MLVCVLPLLAWIRASLPKPTSLITSGETGPIHVAACGAASRDYHGKSKLESGLIRRRNAASDFTTLKPLTIVIAGPSIRLASVRRSRSRRAQPGCVVASPGPSIREQRVGAMFELKEKAPPKRGQAY
jgi:hypothetical protein